MYCKLLPLSLSHFSLLSLSISLYLSLSFSFLSPLTLYLSLSLSLFIYLLADSLQSFARLFLSIEDYRQNMVSLLLYIMYVLWNLS